MKIRFNKTLVSEYASRFDSYNDLPERKIAPAVKERGFLTKDEFLFICEWKSPRTKPHCNKNSPEIIQEFTRLALQSSSEEVRIKALIGLDGVAYPTASTILHFCHEDKYPIIDVRALWSLNEKAQVRYKFDFWIQYVKYCRDLSDELSVDMRTLDKALWQYSKEHQGRLM